MEEKKFQEALKEWQTPKYKNAFLIFTIATILCTIFFAIFYCFGKDTDEIKI